MLIRLWTRDDLPAVANIITHGFMKDEFFDWLWPKRHIYPDDLRRWQMIRLRTRLVSPNEHGFVTVTEEGDPDWTGKPKVTGFAVFVRYGDDEGTKKWLRDSIWNKFERRLLSWETLYETKVLDRTLDPSRLKEYVALDHDGLYAPLGPLWHVAILGVSPEHQRRGIGGKLIKHIQDVASKEGVPVTLEASVPGKGLYLKSGFKIVKDEVVAGALNHVVMVWEPEDLKGKFLEETEEGKSAIRNSQ